LLAGVGILGVYRAHVCALKVLYEDVLEVYPQVDAVREEMLKRCSGTFCEVEQ